MDRQLQLIEEASAANGAAPDWKLDEGTKELGLRGVAAARAALRSAHRDALTSHDANRAA